MGGTSQTFDNMANDNAAVRRSIAIMVSSPPDSARRRHGLALAKAALGKGIQVYLYFIDEGVRELSGPAADPSLADAKMFVCAYSARKRNAPTPEAMIPCGLGTLSELIAGTDRFVSF